jgi:mono/diheme cytochrome c family protein
MNDRHGFGTKGWPSEGSRHSRAAHEVSGGDAGQAAYFVRGSKQSQSPSLACVRFFVMVVILFEVAVVWLIGEGWSQVKPPPVKPQQKEPGKQPLDKDHAQKMAKGLDLFKKQVKAILADRCVRCHGGEKTQSEFDLTDRDGLLRGGKNGPAIIVGKGKDSLLVKLVTHQREPNMPKNGKKLSDGQIAAIAEWIDLGAPYDTPLVAKKDKGPHWSQKVVSALDAKFWSFQPLKKVPLPKVKNQGWCQTPIDYFILDKLEQAGLKPNERASKIKLIRRAYFDLVGLPPTPAEVETFVNDQTPDAYARLIDDLLNSPHYGERQASRWLDLARFAESHGFEHDYDRPTAYHYRDFVIKALNMDLPYDKFVKWQIAGDELEPDNALANMATGFLAAGVHSTQITKNEVEKHRYDEMDDKLNTMSTAMLGLSIGCARCHDHKYDPIPQADYYRMLATFTTTVRTEAMLDLDPAWYKKAKAEFDKNHEPLLKELEKFEAEKLAPKLAELEKAVVVPEWVILDPVSAKSSGEATLIKQSDGSILATGKNPQFDTYTIVAEAELTGFTAIRLEALSHPSMPKGGPGRAPNGNFALSDFEVTLALKGGAAPPVKLKLSNPRATFEQKGLPVAAAIDKDAKSSWAVDPEFGKDHAAVFDVQLLPLLKSNHVLTFTLKFNNNTGHNMGRVRLSVSNSKGKLPLLGNGMPQTVRSALDTPVAKRTPQQQKTLLHWFALQDAAGQKIHAKINQHLAKAPQPKLAKVLIASEGLPAVRLHTQGDDFFPKTFFLKRGDANYKEGEAKQSYLQVLMRSPDKEKHWHVSPPVGWRTSYRRASLANWITDVDEGAGHLLARVIVNRLWQQHLGRGIVATPSDFGTRGEKPSHPELLDWLAQELINNGWRLKPIHKLIMTSAVYQQSAEHGAEQEKADPENKLFGHFNRRRLEAEAVRDSLLAVSGVLDQSMFGPGTLDEGMKKRSIYFTIKRSKLIPMLQIFDASQALTAIDKRPSTTVAPQALLLMNNPHVRSWAHTFARRIAPDDKTPVVALVRQGYLLALSREPTAQELVQVSAFVQKQQQTYPGPSARHLAVADFCQVLMCLNEFIYVD